MGPNNKALRRKMRASIVIVLTATIGLLGVANAATTSTTTLNIGASGDSYATQFEPAGTRANYKSLMVSSPSSRISYIKFVVSGLPQDAVVADARLTLKAQTTSSIALRVHSFTNQWQSSVIDWNNKEPMGAVLGTSAGTTKNKTLSLDLGKAITANGTYSFAIDAPTGNEVASFVSIDSSYADGPKLAINWHAPASTTTAEPSTTTAVPTTTTADLRAIAASQIAGSSLALPAGIFSFKDFQSDNAGVSLGNKSLAGAGVDRTIIDMVPNSSTKSALVPTKTPQSNTLTLLKAGGSPTLSDFTLLGTEQGHLYNGLHVDGTTNARISNVKVKSIPADDHVPPGETAGFADVHTVGSLYSNIEVDGTGIGGSGVSTASSTNLTVNGGYSHDNKYSAGAAIWNTVNTTLTDFKSTNNRVGINLEQDTGVINIERPVFAGNQEDFYIGSSKGSAKITITDPTFTTAKLHIRIPATYGTSPETQKKSDIRVIINGVDRTNSIVQWDS